MNKSGIALRYWEKKILNWEHWRYSKWLVIYPFSWTIRLRLIRSSKIISSRILSDWSVLELGCGSGYLARRIGGKVKNYLGVDIANNAITLARKKNKHSHIAFIAADVSTLDFQKHDLVVFLGLTDWLEENELRDLFRRMQAVNVFFSFTETRSVAPWSPYKLYRKIVDREQKANHYKARTYTENEIRKILGDSGYSGQCLKRASFYDPGVLFWAKK